MDTHKSITKDKTRPESARTARKVTPLVDIFENDHEILLYVVIPGVAKDGVKVDIDNGVLTLSGARKIERRGVLEWDEIDDVEYQRSFSVPQSIDIDEVKADLVDGVLALHLPKSEAAKPKTIEITAG